jgi:hypothetical protein
MLLPLEINLTDMAQGLKFLYSFAVKERKILCKSKKLTRLPRGSGGVSDFETIE